MLDRWLSFTASLAPSANARALWHTLDALYRTGDRPYHSLAHIHECLDRLDSWRRFARRPDELEFALWLHDAIYEPGSALNEEQSADAAAAFARELRLGPEFERRARELIMRTKHAPGESRGDDALMVDIDMAILASGAARYDDYAAAVRAEYRAVPNADWRRGRGAFLRGLLERARIFHSEPGAELEPAARANIARELAAL